MQNMYFVSHSYVLGPAISTKMSKGRSKGPEHKIETFVATNDLEVL